MDFLKNILTNFKISRKQVKVISVHNTSFNSISEGGNVNKSPLKTNSVNTTNISSMSGKNNSECKETQAKYSNLNTVTVITDDKKNIESHSKERTDRQVEIETLLLSSNENIPNIEEQAVENEPEYGLVQNEHTDKEISYCGTNSQNDKVDTCNKIIPVDDKETNLTNSEVYNNKDLTVSDISSPTFNDDEINNNNNKSIFQETSISLDEFETILKARINPSGNPLDLDEIDEYITNIDNELSTNTIVKIKSEFEDVGLAIGAVDCENLVDIDEDLNSEIISISSDDADVSISDITVLYEQDNKDTISLCSDGGSYHSSDFEFISESEAKLDGLIINCKAPKKRNVRKESLVIRKEFSDNDLNEPGPSKIFDNKENFPPNKLFENVIPLRQNHIVPEGANFLALFQGVYNPILPHSEILFLENKSVRTITMHTEFEGLGFDRYMARRRNLTDPNDEFEDEAKENAKKILEMYPAENRKRKRRS